MVFSIKRNKYFLVLEKGGATTPVDLKPEGDAPSAAEQASSSEQAESKPPVLQSSGPASGQTIATTETSTPATTSDDPSPEAVNTATTNATGAETAPAETEAAETAETAPSAVVTTAESIAAELAAAEAERPALTFTTFAPDNLLPGQALIQRRRRPGASMKSFSGMAEELFKS